MCSSQEEQADELMCLEAVFPEELEIVSPQHFKIRVEGIENAEHVVFLELGWPDDYPNQVPSISVVR